MKLTSLCRHKWYSPVFAECIQEDKLISALITYSHSQFVRILDLSFDDNSSADEQESQKSKSSVLSVSSCGSLEDWAVLMRMCNDSKIMWTYSCQINTSNTNRSKKFSN